MPRNRKKKKPTDPPIAAKIEQKFDTGETSSPSQPCAKAGGGSSATVPVKSGPQDPSIGMAAMNVPKGVVGGGGTAATPSVSAVPVTAQPETVVVYRKMCDIEAVETLKTKKLQRSIPGANGKKYLSESRDKVVVFENKGVAKDTDEKVVEFTLDKAKYDALLSDKIFQKDIKDNKGSAKTRVEFHYEGLDKDGKEINIGVPKSKLPAFNAAIVDVKDVTPDEKPK